MRGMMLAACLLAFGSQAHGYAYWNDIRHSAVLPDTTLTVRVENPAGTGVENYLLYAGSEILEEPMIPIVDGPSTVSATVPAPVAGPHCYGFRLIQDQELDVLPVRIAQGVDPAPQDLTQLAADSLGDEVFGYTHLDLVDCHLSFSGSRFYAALENAGGGFPVIQGLTFFGYLLGVADPALADPDTVFGLMQTYYQAGIIGPGLYRIEGTGLGNLFKIGDVVVEEFPTMNTLVISCELADLMADPYFMSWYDPSDPTLGVAAFTQRITLLFGAQEADRSPGGRCYLREFAITPVVNQPPALSDFTLQGTGSEATARIDYWDPDGNCPVLAEITFDDSLHFSLYPLTLDYAVAVTYSTEEGIEPLADNSWTSAVLRFSDNLQDTILYEPPMNGIYGDYEVENPGGLRVSVAPNPFSANATIQFVMPAEGDVRVEIFDITGRLVRTLAHAEVDRGPGVLKWNGHDTAGFPAAPGVYFCRITALSRTEVHKLVSIH
jgi:hypothetical protein